MYNTEDYSLDNEVWKDIPGYEGIYQASSFGRIRSVHGKTTISLRHGIRSWKGKILKPKTKKYKTGYKVCLWKNKEFKEFLVARLIGFTFLGIPLPKLKMTINHKDGNRLNNNIDNIEWLSIGDNIRHAFETGLIKTQKEVTLFSNGCIHKFESMSKASSFLERNNGYVSARIKNGGKITNKNGMVFEVVE